MNNLQISKKRFAWHVDLNEDPLPPSPTADNPLRIAVVGGGDIGLRNANSVKAAPSAVIAAVCDADPGVLHDLARRFDVPAVADYADLLKRDDIDAVLLSLPHHLHAPFALQAAEAGKHVLLEKPLGGSLDDATRIVQGCADAGVRLTVNFSFRYRAAIQLARMFIQNDLLGDVSGVQINLYQYKGASYWAGGYTARAAGDWRTSKQKAGGGILINTACHAVDFVRYCTGLEVKRASGEYGTFGTPTEVEDTISATFQYDNGAVGALTATSYWRAKLHDEVRIWGTHGALRIDACNQVQLWTARRWQQLDPAKEHTFQHLPEFDYTAQWIDRFARGVRVGEAHDITGHDGWINNAVIDAVYTARDTGRYMDVPEFHLVKEVAL